MDYEKAIEKLLGIQQLAKKDMYKSSIYGSPEFAQEEIDACDLAIKAMVKQTSMRMEIEDCRWVICPVCGKAFYGNDKPNYCERCGQKLNWKGL